MLLAHRSFFAVLALSLVADATANVLVVDATGGGMHVSIQAAVDAAGDGDLIVVRPQPYAGFTIDAKSLSIVSSNGAQVPITGGVVVKNLAAEDAVLLSDLLVTAIAGTASAPPKPGLALTSNVGSIRVQRSTFVGGQGSYGLSLGPGAHGVSVSACLDVSLAHTTARGGLGGTAQSPYCVDCHGGRGGDGLMTATSAVALDDCQLEGGRGGNAGNTGGHGGDGARVASWGLFGARSTFRGGAGGEAWDWAVNQGGAGGDGLVLLADTGARLLNDAFVGGAGGFCYLCQSQYGPQGQGTSGPGNFIPVAGFARSFSARSLYSASQAVEIEVFGESGDRVYVSGGGPEFHFKWGWRGTWLIAFPAAISEAPLATLGSSGTVNFSLTLPALARGHERRFLQGVILSSSGQAFVASPISITRVDCAQAPAACTGLP